MLYEQNTHAEALMMIQSLHYYKGDTQMLNKLCLSVFLLIGTCSSVFAVDFFQALTQMKEDVFSMWDVFEGKVVVSNLYDTSLKLAKDREVSATMASFSSLKWYYSECTAIQESDFINILYNSNFSFKQTFDQILPEWTKKPSLREINLSYAAFFACKWIQTPATAPEIAALNEEVNRKYYDGYSNAYALSTLNQDNFWSDLFWNGTLDDSAFDLLYDINQIGKILFEDMQESPEILLYRLPESQQSSAQNGSNTSSLSDQSSYQVWGWSNSSSVSSTSSSASNVSTRSSSVSSLSSTASSDSFTEDKEVQNLISSTKSSSTTSSSSVGSALLIWNQCLSWDDETAPVYEEDEVQLMSPEEYISGIVYFMDHANLNDVVNDTLLNDFYKTNTTTNTNDPASIETVTNTYSEQAFGEAAPGTCEYECKNLPFDEQKQCEYDCAGSCIKKCDDVPWIQEKALCISDCTCFLIAGPNGAWWQKMEDMYRIKFCKVPVQTKIVSPGKKVFSIQAIFQEISDVLQWLRDSGQMVKFSKTKEFLDGTIKINLADNFAFKLQVWFKPVFSKKNSLTKSKEAIQANMNLNLGVLDMNTSAPKADDYNKYLVISDPAKNKASLEQSTSLSDINANIENFSTSVNSYTKVSDEMIDSIRTTYVQWLGISFVQNMVDFLQDNQLFWNNFSEALLDINKMSLELKTKIENSK